MSKFILNIYQLRIHQFSSTKLADDRKDDLKYLKTLHYLYLRTMKLSNDLAEFIRDSNDDLLSKLTQNMFAKHLVNYIDIELRCFDNICAMELRKFYDSKNHQKKQTERFQDLKRDMQAIISARTNINIVQIDNYGGETFLSEELAINLLQESTAALERCSVVRITLHGNCTKQYNQKKLFAVIKRSGHANKYNKNSRYFVEISSNRPL